MPDCTKHGDDPAHRRHYVTADGQCKQCGDYMITDPNDATKCIQPSCLDS
jgi:hypothetical protein